VRGAVVLQGIKKDGRRKEEGDERAREMGGWQQVMWVAGWGRQAAGGGRKLR
jgi:hypothetical protein